MNVNPIGPLLDNLGAKQKRFERRFWEKCRRAKGGCLEWQGSLSDKGYGRAYIPGSRSMFGAHRVAYAMTFGDPEDLAVLHKCDNPKCCEPSHLYAGTLSDNATDRFQREAGVESVTFPEFDENDRIIGWARRSRPKPGDATF